MYLMTYEQYMTDAMESIYGMKHVDVTGVKGSIQHLEGQSNGRPHNFYMAHLKLVGRIVESEDKKDKYNYVSAYGHLINNLIDFMKEQGYELHMIKQFDNRTKDKPEMNFSFTMEGLR
jgi:hypothetical protein